MFIPFRQEEDILRPSLPFLRPPPSGMGSPRPLTKNNNKKKKKRRALKRIFLNFEDKGEWGKKK